MNTVNINDSFQVSCSFKGRGKFHYSITHEDVEFFSKTVNTAPDELGESSAVGKAIMERIEADDTITVNGVEVKLTQKQVQESKLSTFNKIRAELHEKVMSSFQSANEPKIIEDREFHKKYQRYYKMYKKRYADYDCTELDFITAITHGLGVDIGYEIIKAYLTYLQTLLGLKATNLIALGSQASGKTHIIEQALSLIPEEYVHRGTMTEASFFTMYNNCDLSKHIFYLGDLGGVKDDDKTIIFRDLIKELSTDGVVSRNIKDMVENEVITEEVKGHPCLTYTTVYDEMVNEQEASRSALLTPPPINTRKLAVYLQLKECHGDSDDLFNQIEEDKKAVQGLTYHLMQTINNYTLINPYMFVCERYLKNITNYNRKIGEFNELLKLVCILNDATVIESYDEYGETKQVVIANKKSIVTTLYLFDTSDLLPTEIKLFKGLVSKFEPYPVEPFFEGKYFTEVYDDSFDYEREVFINMLKEEYGDGVELETLIEDGKKKTIGGNNQYRNEVFDVIDPDYLFTVSTLRRYSNQSWYRENKSVISVKLHKFYELGLLIRVGKTNDGKVIYGLHKDAEVDYIKPVWDKTDINQAVQSIKKNYSDIYQQIIEDMDNDSNYRDKTIPLDNNNSTVYEIYDLIWEDVKSI